MTALYLLIIYGDTDPMPLRGPYKSDAHRLRAARRYRRTRGDRDGIYRVDCNGPRVVVYSFASGEIAP